MGFFYVGLHGGEEGGASAAAILATIGNERFLAVEHKLHAMAMTCFMHVCYEILQSSSHFVLHNHWVEVCKWVAFQLPQVQALFLHVRYLIHLSGVCTTRPPSGHKPGAPEQGACPLSVLENPAALL